MIRASVIWAVMKRENAVDAGCMEAARDYATALGLAFQIRDDILDLTSSLEELGKQTGSDLKNHKVTYVSLNGMEQSEKDVRRLSEEALLELKGLTEERNEFLERLVEDLITRKK